MLVSCCEGVPLPVELCEGGHSCSRNVAPKLMSLWGNRLGVELRYFSALMENWGNKHRQFFSSLLGNWRNKILKCFFLLFLIYEKIFPCPTTGSPCQLGSNTFLSFVSRGWDEPLVIQPQGTALIKFQFNPQLACTVPHGGLCWWSRRKGPPGLEFFQGNNIVLVDGLDLWK